MNSIADPLQNIRLLVVDHRALIRDGVSGLLVAVPGIQVIGQARNGSELLEIMHSRDADVILLDIDMPDSETGIRLIADLCRSAPSARIVVLTNNQSPSAVRGALQAGAISYLLKSTSVEALIQAIAAARGGTPTLSAEVTKIVLDALAKPRDFAGPLSSREKEVLRLIVRGWNNQRIGQELCISSSTVQFHVGNILSKLQVTNRTQAAAYAMQHQLTQDEPN